MTREKGPGLSSTGNRVLLAVVAGVVGYVVSGQQVWVFFVVAAVAYLLLTVTARRS